MKKYDDILSFDLPEGYEEIRGINDSGNPTYAIGAGKTVDENGQDQYTYRLNLLVVPQDYEADQPDSPVIRLAGNIQNQIRFHTNSTAFMGIAFTVTTGFIMLIHEKTSYLCTSVVAGGGDRLEGWINFLNDVLNAVVLDGKKGGFEPLTSQMVADASAAAQLAEEASLPFPAARPKENQHTHLDFLEKTAGGLGFLGGLVQMNATGTEYCFEQMADCYSDRSDDEKIIGEIAKADKVPFALASTAREMGEIFRVSKSAFNSGEDREQEIENGLLRRCKMYEAFRSFAWTLAAYCDRMKTTPAQVDIDTITEITDFVVEQRNRLNYTADSFCPTLCSGDDIHNYYIPDGVSAKTRSALIENMSGGDEAENMAMDPEAHILSLEGLRKDLEYLFPAMQTIYDYLAKDRDFDEALEGPVPEVLYAWCAMTYAARAPIHTEDGPVNCFWAHPGKMPVLKSFGTKSVSRGPKKTDCGFRFTYEQGLKFENEHYDIRLPDGFVIKTGEEDRDFIAYLPASSAPDDYTASDFTVFAGQSMDGSVNAQLKLVLSYHSILSGFAMQIPGTLLWYYHRKDLPGIIAASPDSSCLHANAILAYGETLKMIRFQINVSSKKQAEACEDLIKSVLDQMTAKNPVKLLDQIDDPKFVGMNLTATEVSKWTDLIDEYASQIVIARNKEQEYLVEGFRKKNPGLAKIKKTLKTMLQKYTEFAADCLRKADMIYQLKCAQYPENSALKKMKKSIDDAFMDLVVQFVNLDGERIESRSEYMEVYQKHTKSQPDKAIADILKSYSDKLDKATVATLESAHAGYALLAEKAKAEAAKRKAAEEARKEAERKEKSYNEALQHMQSNNEKTVAKALSALRALKDYRDAEALAAECVKKLEAIEEEKEKARQEAARKAEEERKRREAEERQRRLEEEARRKREEEARIAAEKAAAEKRAAEEAAARERAEQKRKKKERFLKKLKRTLITLLVIALVLGTIAVLTPTVILPAVEKARDYQSAQQYLEVGRYDEAEAKFRSLGTYKDSADLVFVARYQKAEYLLETRQYPEAIALWQELGSYMDSAQRAADALVQWREPDYSAALAQMEQGSYLAAADLFSTLEGYKDSAEKAEECKALHTEQLYRQAQEAMESGAYPEAMEIYKQLGDYRDSRQLYQTCAYEHAVALLAAKEYVDASAYFTLASGYRDAAQLRKEADYQHGIQLLTAGKYADAINQLGKCKGYSNADKKIMDAKYGYVQANFSRDNKTTQNYLKELIAAKYNGAQKLYDELYAWKVEIIAFNNTPYNHTSQNTVSKYQGMYCHFKVTGGEPGKTINLKVKVTAPNGQSGTIHFNSCSDGSIWSTRFSYDNPYYGATGTMSVVIYDAATNRKMDSGSVQVTN